MTEEKRRASDGIILEMHGMLTTLVERLDGHMKWEEKEHDGLNVKIATLEERMAPLEETRKSLQAAWKALATVLGSVLVGAGLSVWFWIKSRIAPHLPTQ